MLLITGWALDLTLKIRENGPAPGRSSITAFTPLISITFIMALQEEVLI
jgi:hypothetical protein